MTLNSARGSGLLTQLALAATVAATVGCDHVTKQVASSALAGTPGRSLVADAVRLVYVENSGGFLSLGANWPAFARTVLFTVGTGVLLLALAALAIRIHRRGLPAFGLALFVGGGLSNWFDRAVHGRVVDFMIVGAGPLRTGVFNVADVAIMAGAAIFIASELRPDRHDIAP